MATLTLPDGDPAVAALRLVLNYCSSLNNFKVQAGAELGVLLEDGEQVFGLNPVARYIVSQADAQLLGTTPDEQAQVAQWLTWCNTELTPLLDDKLAKLNDWLLMRTFLVGNRVTLADLLVFAKVQPAAASFPAAQAHHFCNLLRWCDFLQHIADSQQRVFKTLELQRPRFQPPPPPASAASSGAGGPKPAPAKGDAPAAKPAAKLPSAAPATSGASATSTSTATPDAKGQQQQPRAKEVKSKQQPASSEASSTAAAPQSDATSSSRPTGAADIKGAKSKRDKEPPPAAAAADAGAAAPAAAGADAAKPKKEKAPASKKEDDDVRIDMLDIRVGQIVKVGKHPNADALYLEEIDVGEGKPRQVISGLVKFVPQEQMENRRVLCVCNLKPAKMRDVMSHGMVLCASNETHDQVEPVAVPADVPLGERVLVEGYSADPLVEVNPKKKILERLFPDMRTRADGVATYKGAAFMTSKGPVTSAIVNAWVK